VTIKVAACQIDPKLGEVEANLDLIARAVGEAAAAGSTFTVLPEAAVTGYAFASLSEALPVARKAGPSPSGRSTAWPRRTA
jgi:predicted amidohydrolase